MSIPRRIFFTMLGTASVAVITIVVLLFWIAANTDRIAAEETTKRVALAVQGMVTRTAFLTEDYAYWQAAYDWYMQADDQALYDNLGSGAADSASFDMIYLVDPQGIPTHAYGTGVYRSDLEFVQPEIISAVIPLLMEQPLAGDTPVSGLVMLWDEIAVVSAARIQPDDTLGMTAGNMPMLVGVVWLDPATLGASLLLDDLQLASLDTPLPAATTTLQLADIAGKPMATLLWLSPDPGAMLLEQAMPAIVVLAALLLIGCTIAGRISANQATAHMREHVLARTDLATGLLNRTGFAELTRNADMNAAIGSGRAALIYVDVDGLKGINDTYGHNVGDIAIEVSAKRIRSAVRLKDHVARLGGDEFVCLIVDDNVDDVAAQIAARITRKTQIDFVVAGATLTATVSTGTAAAQKGATWENLLNQADEAMFRAKRRKYAEQAATFVAPVAASG